MTAPTEVTIGEFARRTGLSAKALRLYEERGFLRPVRVDDRSGYRYYDLGQIERARTIALLRRLDLPLAEVAAVLEAAPDEVGPRLRTWWSQRHRHLVDRQNTLELVIRALAPIPDRHVPVPDVAPADVTVSTVPGATVATVRREVAQAELVPAFTADLMVIRHHLTDAGARFGAAFFVIYHDVIAPDIAGPIETCVPYEGVVTPVGDIALRVEPSRRVAAVPITGADCSYPRIMGAYAVVGSWVDTHARPVAPIRELYNGAWGTDVVVAHVAQPIADDA